MPNLHFPNVRCGIPTLSPTLPKKGTPSKIETQPFFVRKKVIDSFGSLWRGAGRAMAQNILSIALPCAWVS